MSNLSDKLLQATSKPQARPAMLVLEDGAAFSGTACAAEGEAFGEICFNTSLEGYLEVITDPSYAGQIITMTYPQIGNYGVNLEDVQSAKPACRGLVVRDMCQEPSNWRCDVPLPRFLEDNGIIAIEGVDTRALVRHVRDAGAQRAVISTVDTDVESLLAKVRASASIVGENLAATVSCDAVHPFDAASLPASQAFAIAAPEDAKHKVVAYDCGAKLSILHNLVRCGCGLTVVPWDTPAEDVLAIPAAALNRGDTVLVTADSPSAAGAEAQQPEDGTDAETSAGGGDAETAGDESSQYVSVQVTTGISDDSYIEITSGLQEGDTVVYIPTTSSDSDMGMMGGMPGGGGGMPGGGGGGMGGGPGGF